MIKHKKKFGIYHWDTFDNETFFKHEADTIEAAEEWIKDHYKDRLKDGGADRVDIVDSLGNIVKQFNVG